MLLNTWVYKSYPSLCKVPSPERTLAFLPSREQWHGRFFCSLPRHYPSRWPKGVSVLQGHSILFQLGYLTLVPQLPHFLRSIFVNFFFWKFRLLISFPLFASEGTGQECPCGRGRYSLRVSVSQGKQSEKEESAVQMGERQILPLAGSLGTRMTWAGSPGGENLTNCCALQAQERAWVLPGWHVTWMWRKKGQERGACDVGPTCMRQGRGINAFRDFWEANWVVGCVKTPDLVPPFTELHFQKMLLRSDLCFLCMWLHAETGLHGAPQDLVKLNVGLWSILP